jgi:lipopolysaccharide export LptBFGC system permease protein LptF
MLLKRPFSKGERATYRFFAYAALAAGLPFLGSPFTEQGFSKENIQTSFIWGIPCAAAIWMMILSAKELNPEESTTIALQAAWLPNAIFCAVGFWGDGWQIGAYLAAFTIVLYAVEITLSMRGKSAAGVS